MHRKRSRVMLAGVLTLMICLTVGLMSGGAADAKKKKKKKKKVASPPVTLTVNKSVNATVPDALLAAPGTYGKLSTPLEVTGTNITKKVVGNVDVTFQTTGDIADAADDLDFQLIAPNGRRVFLGPDNGVLGGQSIGPLTLTANSAAGVCNAVVPPCADPDQSLNRPFAGTAGQTDLALFDGIKMGGTWTFVARDKVNTKTSILNSVNLVVASAKPVK